MKTVAKNKLYEGMFLVDSARAGADWDGVIAAITTILEKVKAEIVSIRKWDDRKLAYAISGKTRGTYILCYFRADGRKIQDIEKAVQLSEQIMRVLILNAEQMTAEDMEKDTPVTKAEKEKDKRKDDTDKETQETEDEQMSGQQEDELEDDAEQAKETGQAWEETEGSQESEPGAVAEDSMQEQSKLGQVEDSEKADEQEQLQP